MTVRGPITTTLVTGRSAKLDPTSTVVADRGGYATPKAFALSPQAGNAEWRTYRYEVQLFSGATMVDSYAVDYSDWYAGTGQPTDTSPPTTTPPTPTIAVENSANPGFVSCYFPTVDTQYNVLVYFEKSNDGGTTWTYQSGVISDYGALRQDVGSFPAGVKVRAKIAYNNAQGNGPFSAYSNIIQIADVSSSGGSLNAPAVTIYLGASGSGLVYVANISGADPTLAGRLKWERSYNGISGPYYIAAIDGLDAAQSSTGSRQFTAGDYVRVSMAYYTPSEGVGPYSYPSTPILAT